MTTKTIKTPDVEWVYSYDSKPVTSIEQMPDDVFGFVYLIVYVDGTRYIGKKNVFKYNNIKSRKDGVAREGTIRQIQKNSGKGYRVTYDVVKSESDWRTYQGSHKECKIRKPSHKEILEYANSQKKLTYLEAKYLFSNAVLESNMFLNDNILGTFFRSDLS